MVVVVVGGSLSAEVGPVGFCLFSWASGERGWGVGVVGVGVGVCKRERESLGVWV